MIRSGISLSSDSWIQGINMDLFQQQFERFSNQIEQELQSGSLSFPTAFDVTMRIRRLANDNSASLEDVAAVVQLEPMLSARVVRLANSAGLNRSGRPITSVTEAISRIGLATLRSLALAVSFEQLAQDARSPNLRRLGTKLWEHSLDVACWSSAMAKELSIAPPDTAMFAGMLIDIGEFYLFARAAEYPIFEANLDQFAEFVVAWHEPVARAILESFSLPDVIINAFRYEDVYGGSWPPADLGDIIFLADVISEHPDPVLSLLKIEGPTLEEIFVGQAETEQLSKLVDSVSTCRNNLLAALKT